MIVAFARAYDDGRGGLVFQVAQTSSLDGRDPERPGLDVERDRGGVRTSIGSCRREYRVAIFGKEARKRIGVHRVAR